MARRPVPGGRPGSDYEPDWTEEELEEKLNALRRRGGNKSARLDADLRKHGIDLNLDSRYARGEPEDFEPLDDEEDTSSKAVGLAQSLYENEEWEELEQLAKVQIIMDPFNAKRWRNIAKNAAKGRRLQRPRIVRFFLLVLKIIGGLVVLILALGIIGAFVHH